MQTLSLVIIVWVLNEMERGEHGGGGEKVKVSRGIHERGLGIDVITLPMDMHTNYQRKRFMESDIEARKG